MVLGRQTFFEHTIFERDLGNDFLELPVLSPQILDFVAGGFAHGVSRELLLARFEEVLTPAIVEVRGNSLTTAQFRDALLTPKAFEDNPHLLLGRELPAGAAANLPHCCFGGLLLLRHIETHLGALDHLKCLLA